MKKHSVDNATRESIRILKILTNHNRFAIIDMLTQRPEGMCVHEIADALDISHSATSHQLTRLEERGVLSATRHGQTICYELTDTPLSHMLTTVITQCRTTPTHF